MTQEKILKVLVAVLAIRSVYYKTHGNDPAAYAYENACELAAYAAAGDWDCLRQFGWIDEAEELVDKIGENVDFLELERMIFNTD